MMQILAGIHCLPGDQRHAEWHECRPAAGRTQLHQAWADGCTPRLHDRRSRNFFTFSGLLSLLSLLPLLLCALAFETFQGQGWSRPVYFTILTSHTILAIVILPHGAHYADPRIAGTL